VTRCLLALLLVVGCNDVLGVEERSLSAGEGGNGGDGCDLLACGEACVDPLSSASHCGWCGHACPVGEACVGGVCDPTIGVSAGAKTACMRGPSGALSCIGAGAWGQLGRGEAGDSETAAPVEILPADLDVRYAAADAATCVLAANGDVRCFGQAQHGYCGIGMQYGPEEANGVESCCYVTQVALRAELPRPATALIEGGAADRLLFYCALLDDERVYCWGRGPSEASTPYKRAEDMIQIHPASGWACGVSADRTAGCWGMPIFGGTSNVTSDTFTTAYRVDGLDQVAWIGGGHATMCARRFNGDILCWGANDHRELGPDYLEDFAYYPPQPLGVALPGEVALIRGTDEALCALLVSGEVYCWGAERHLGNGATGAAVEVVPQRVPLDGVVEIAGVSEFMLARTADGRFHRWGSCDDCSRPQELVAP
jgi:alpha-tubulin suppressor-like RCC1 family protein